MHFFGGNLSERLETASQMIDAVAQEAGQKYPGKGLDLVVLPEYAIQTTENGPVSALAVPLEGTVLETMGSKARQYRTYLIVPMILLEKQTHKGRKQPIYSNACVLLDRQGKVAGVYRKVHPVGVPAGIPFGKDVTDTDQNSALMGLEGGITPGKEFPVFSCDFGKVGILVCWDMSYEDGWLELSRKGAEIVAISTASPQTVRPASFASRCRFHVVTSTPRNNVTIFNPIGMVAAQATASGVLVHEIDLSFAVLSWSAILRDGKLFTERFGDKAGYLYSEREDHGVFWSNDPPKTIGSMVRELGLLQQHEQVQRDCLLQDAARGQPVPCQPQGY